MANRPKADKGFWTLLLGESLYSSLLVGASLTLVNLPLALVAAAIDFSANMVSGFIVGPRDATLASFMGTTPEDQNKSRLQKAKTFAKKFLSYNLSCFKDPDYTVGASAAGAGINFFFQGALGLKSLLATHVISILPGLALTGLSLPVGVGIAAAMTALGAISIVAGNMDKWRGLNKYYHKIFGKGEPENINRGLKYHPVIKKIFDNKVSNILKRILLGAMTIESSLFIITAASAAIIRHGIALLQSTKTLFSSAAAMGWAGVCGWRGTWQVLSVGRIAVRGALRKWPSFLKIGRAAAAAKKIAPALPPAVAIEAVQDTRLEKTVTDTFKKSAARDAAQETGEQVAVQMAAQPSRPKHRRAP